MSALFETKDLKVAIDGTLIIKGVNLVIGRGEVHALMGPNGSGKTIYTMAVMGYPGYKTSGAILFEGNEIGGKTVSERAKMGIAIAFQHPPEIPGVKLRDLIRKERGAEPWNPFSDTAETVASPYLKRAGLEPSTFLRRDINVGFSGGERKRAELAQILAMEPRLMILDEIDSGVDIDSLRLIGQELNGVMKERGCSVLIVTHYRHILQYVKPSAIHIMYDGRIVSSGPPDEILAVIEAEGYDSCIRSLKKVEA
jgi:Fe-S cluster assembly ATP-binding protein